MKGINVYLFLRRKLITVISSCNLFFYLNTKFSTLSMVNSTFELVLISCVLGEEGVEGSMSVMY